MCVRFELEMSCSKFPYKFQNPLFQQPEFLKEINYAELMSIGPSNQLKVQESLMVRATFQYAQGLAICIMLI